MRSIEDFRFANGRRAAGKNKSADLLQAVSEDQFGAETFASLLAIETPPVYLER